MRISSSSLRGLPFGLGALALLCACGLFPIAPAPVPTPPALPPPSAPVPTPPIAAPGLPTPPMPSGLPAPAGLPVPAGLPIPPGLPLPGIPGTLPTTLPAGSLVSTAPPPDPGTLAPMPPDATDANGLMTVAFLEREAEAIYRELLGGLTAEHRARVARIPFHVMDDRIEPNAAAGCAASSGAPLVFITHAMLVVAAGTSEARAFDELAGTRTYEAYADTLGPAMFAGRPIAGLAPSSLGGPHARSAVRLARARHLFDQQIAFILGHELAHHYRGHTGCAGGGTASREEAEALARSLADTASMFQQPFEVEADSWGITSVLEVGHARPAGRWNEEGALLSLDTFRRLAGVTDLPSAFLSTHPPSELRAPIVRQISAAWAPGRAPLPEPTLDERGLTIDLGTGPITLPIPR